MSSSASEILREFMYHYGCHIFIEVLFWWRMSAHRAHCCSAVIHHVVTQVEERKDGVLTTRLRSCNGFFFHLLSVGDALGDAQ